MSEPWENPYYTEAMHVAYENELWLEAILDRVRWPIDDDQYEVSLDDQSSEVRPCCALSNPEPQ